MKRDFLLARAQEQQALRLEPPRFPAHLGEAHAQTALESDLVYRQLVLAALTMAFFAGTGFGRLPAHPGASALSAALWAMTAAGLAARCVGARAAWSNAPVREQVARVRALCLDYGVQDWRPLLRHDRMARLEEAALPPEAVAEIRAELARLAAIADEAEAARAPTLQLFAGLTALFGVLGSIGAPTAGIWSGLGALAATALLWLTAQHRALMRPLGLAAVAAVGLAVPWASAPDDATTALLLLTEAAGLACAAAMLLLARDPLGGINVPQAFTRIAAIGWLYSTWDAGAADLPHSLFLIASGAALVALDIASARRSSFIPTIATAMLLQLTAAPPIPDDLHAPLWAEIPVTTVLFLVLIAAGYRHALAAMLRLPPATYRRAPRCIVPRLDETWGHPVEIYVV